MEDEREKAHVSVWSAAADPTCLASFNLSAFVSAYATYNVDSERRHQIVTDLRLFCKLDADFQEMLLFVI